MTKQLWQFLKLTNIHLYRLCCNLWPTILWPKRSVIKDEAQTFSDFPLIWFNPTCCFLVFSNYWYQDFSHCFNKNKNNTWLLSSILCFNNQMFWDNLQPQFFSLSKTFLPGCFRIWYYREYLFFCISQWPNMIIWCVRTSNVLYTAVRELKGLKNRAGPLI